MTKQSSLEALAKATKQVSRGLPNLTTESKQRILREMAAVIETSTDEIRVANEKDLRAAKEKGLSSAMIDRLTLTPDRIKGMADSLREVAELPDPVGEIVETRTRPNGLKVQRMRIPLGVIGVIYESRPNVTVEATALCFYAGNGLLLRGGSEAFHSNQLLVRLLKKALESQGLTDAVNIVPTTSRETVDEMARMDEYLDVIIPRGGEGLIRRVKRVATVPVIAHYKGNCHVYIDDSADLTKARNIVINGKVQRPGVCNAVETVLIHKAIAGKLLPLLLNDLHEKGVEVRGCERTRAYSEKVLPVTDEDYATEFLDLILAVRVVDSLEEAIDHIRKYGSNHTEAIVSETPGNQDLFIKSLDSSAIMVNASTRFNDGGQLGLGAEIGISTTKLHAFGPMGVRELTTTKFVVFGEGQVRN
ncbi:MAG: glutamate-5-semialdehyde dehydrogenase [FCB group bacterium]|nr:glutamate-5-semialdehyde dehydrogenase [FCB group bacterium]